MKDLQVQLYGPCDGPTGYDAVTRATAFQLLINSVRTRLTKLSWWSKDTVDYPTKPVIDEMEKTAFIGHPQVTLNICLPEQVILDPGCYNANYTMFEADRVPLNWVVNSNRLDNIIVPSQSSADAFVKAGVRADKIEVIPLGVDTVIYKPENHPIPISDRNTFKPLLDAYPIRFLCIAEGISRKNFMGLIRAWVEEVTLADNAVLMLKINAHSTGMQLNFEKALDGILSSARRRAAPVYAFHQLLIEELMPQLCAWPTHYISASCGEGFGYPEFQCAASGKVLVVPRHTTFKEFFNEDLVYYSDVEEVNARQTGATYRIYNGAKWWRPTVAGMRKAIRAAINGWKSGKEDKHTKVLEHVRQKFHTTVFGDKLVAFLKDKAWSFEAKATGPIIFPEGLTREKLLVFVKSFSKGRQCGIAAYAQLLGPYMQDVFGPVPYTYTTDHGLGDVLSERRPEVLQMHVEYGFHSPGRLAVCLRRARELGSTSVITMHTINHEAASHNRAIAAWADGVIVGTPVMKEKFLEFTGMAEDRVKVIPLAVFPENVKEPQADPNGYPVENDPEHRWVDIGYFGLAFHHKGLPILIQMLRQARALEKAGVLGKWKIRLKILSQKPPGDTTQAFEAAWGLIDMFGLRDRVSWVTEFLEEANVVDQLSKCHLVCLPYNEYGGYAASAAMTTILKAGVPIVASPTNFFSDIPEELIWKTPNEFLCEWIFGPFLNEVMPSWLEYAKEVVVKRAGLFADRNPAKVVQAHKEFFDYLKGKKEVKA